MGLISGMQACRELRPLQPFLSSSLLPGVPASGKVVARAQLCEEGNPLLSVLAERPRGGARSHGGSWLCTPRSLW